MNCLCKELWLSVDKVLLPSHSLQLSRLGDGWLNTAGRTACCSRKRLHAKHF